MDFLTISILFYPFTPKAVSAERISGAAFQAFDRKLVETAILANFASWDRSCAFYTQERPEQIATAPVISRNALSAAVMVDAASRLAKFVACHAGPVVLFHELA